MKIVMVIAAVWAVVKVKILTSIANSHANAIID